MPDFMYVRRNQVLAGAVALIAVLAVVAVLVMGGGSDSKVDSATSTTSADVAATPPSLAPGETIPVGVIKSVTVTDLSEACTAGMADMRAIMAEFKSGLAISAPADIDRLNAALSKYREACSDEEEVKIENEELTGWFNAATGATVGAPGSDVSSTTAG